jgi:preprotein translocase subunit SecA
MDQLKEGINLRAYGQKDPLLEYKGEGYRAFTAMLAQMNEEVVELVFRAQVQKEPRFAPRRVPQQMSEVHESADGMGFSSTGADQAQQQQVQQGRRPPQKVKRVPVVAGPKVGRNDPCPCGSGKKYKKCCGS